MDFDFTEEQTQLQDSIAKFVQENYDLPTRTKAIKSKTGYSEDHWKQFAELGWLALPFSEEDGGLDGSYVDTLVVSEALGKGLVVEPYYATVILAGTALRIAGNAEQKQKLIGGIIDGTVKATVAYAELQARYELNDVATTATKEGDSFVINGEKSVVTNAETADYIIVSARTSGERTSSKGISLFIVDAKAEGISRIDYPTVDGGRGSEMTFSNVKVAASDLLGELDEGLEILEEVRDQAILALCAEAVGQMELMYKDTVEYCSQREQFGHPLSDFQVLKHRFADMFVETEQCISLLYRATLEKQIGAPTARRTIHALKYKVGKEGNLLARQAVQSHGGMGVTEELRLGHYFMRLAVIDTIFGNYDYHMDKYCEQMDIPEGGDGEDFGFMM
jgi:alkylation response protein AidB-like acyl-CoA dehydrogenase